MHPRRLTFAVSDFPDLTERRGLTGQWSWAFASGQHTWSAGLYRLLGIEPCQERTSYGQILRVVHPADRAQMAGTTQVLRGEIAREQCFRIIRPNGQLRWLSAHHEVYLASDGRPRGAAGSFLDITDLTVLQQAKEDERRRRVALIQHRCAIPYVYPMGGGAPFSDHVSGMFAATPEEILADPHSVIAPSYREMVRTEGVRLRQAGLVVRVTAPLLMADGGETWFHSVEVPIRDASGRLIEYSGILYPATKESPIPAGSLSEDLDKALLGYHLRAARALLGWSMADLASASGLSLSTVRRLEEDASDQIGRSRHRAIAALKHAGIVFKVLENGVIAVARR